MWRDKGVLFGRTAAATRNLALAGVRTLFSAGFVRRMMAAGALSLMVTPGHALELGEAVRIPEIALIDGAVLGTAQSREKVVLVLFWATWCPICVGELPYLEHMQARHRARGLQILAISLDDSPIDVQRFWRSRGFAMAAAMRTPELRETFGPVLGTPTFYLLDRRGVVRDIHLGRLASEPFEAALERLLK